MDPERLAWLRDSSTGCSKYDALVAELLADRDYHANRADEAERALVDEQQSARHYASECGAALAKLAMADTGEFGRVVEDLEREVEQLRQRVPLTVEDIERAGITHLQVTVWALKNAVQLTPSFRGQLRPVLLISSLEAWAGAFGRSPRTLLAEIAEVEVLRTAEGR